MRERSGLEAELTRLRGREFDQPPPPGEKKTEKKNKKATPLPKSGPTHQLGQPTPPATGEFEPDEPAPAPAKTAGAKK